MTPHSWDLGPGSAGLARRTFGSGSAPADTGPADPEDRNGQYHDDEGSTAWGIGSSSWAAEPAAPSLANRLRRAYPTHEASITVVDQDDRHVYQPGLLFVPFGLAHPDEIVRPRGRQLHRGIDFVDRAIDRVDIESQPRVPRPTAPASTTTCWSSPPAPCSCPRRPRA